MSEKLQKGGTTHKTNLRPICASCNLGCGVQNLQEFKDNIKKSSD